jgi:hypothetical protein
MKKLVYGQLMDVDSYYMKKFTKKNTDKAWIKQMSEQFGMPEREVLAGLNTLQDKGLITRLTKDKLKIIELTS